MYEKYTSWEFHGKLYDDSSDEENDHGNDFGNHDSGFAMLQDAYGVAAMNVGLDEDTSNENNLMPEEPTDTHKFYRLLKEYQQPLTIDGTTMSKLSYIVKVLHLKTAEDMRWHSEDKFNDDIMRHPCDSIAWKSFDMEFITFGKESRNVRLGLACDGFQPFNNSQHSTSPVVLIPYNLPP
uniref:Transposase n=1 Tax=Chenopodium quinoa TaxID=63459 RepID=A0A803MKL6_CHEQI